MCCCQSIKYTDIYLYVPDAFGLTYFEPHNIVHNFSSVSSQTTPDSV